MTLYQVADGFNNAAGLATLTPQPASDGILFPKLVHAASGASYEDGLAYTIWRFTMLSASDFATLLSQMGVTTARSNEATVRTNTGGDRSTFANYNAVIVKPFNPRFRNGFYRDVDFLVRNLEAI